MSATNTTRKWFKVNEFVGLPKREDFKIVEEELPPLKDGEILVEAQYITVDPYMRTGMGSKVGTAMGGEQVAKVIESKNKDYSVGELVQGMLGWTTKSIVSDYKTTMMRKVHQYTLDKPSNALGVLGMTGATAYLGLIEVGKPKAGETLVVTAAAGAVGSIVGQIGKILGLRVVGFTGSDEKVSYLKSIGFDAAYNYKTISSLNDAIKEGCPNGVDVFFDNVGGEFFETVLSHMNTFGRVAVCGAIAEYNNTDPRQAKAVNLFILTKQLSVQGFVCFYWIERWIEAFKPMSEWIKESKLQYSERIYEGFDNMCEAFISLFLGTNTGKVVIKV